MDSFLEYVLGDLGKVPHPGISGGVVKIYDIIELRLSFCRLKLVWKPK
jgi:hypothetical protein